MTENTEEKENQREEKLNQVLQNERRSKGERRSRKSDRQFSIWLFLSFIGMLCALGLSGWVFYEQYKARPWSLLVDDHLKESASRIAVLESLVPGMKSLNESIEKLVEADLRQEAMVEEKLKETLEAVDKRLGVTSEDWIMAEVEYLLRLANQRISLDDDVASALKLMVTADNILRQADVVTAFELRQAIASDIIVLESQNNVDRQGLFAELTAIHNLVKDLKQKQYEFEKADVQEVNQSNVPEGWKDRLTGFGKRIGMSFSRLVDFRRNATPIKPLLPPEEEYYLRHNLQLKIELARIAMLRGDQVVFDQSLAESKAWVSEHFDAEDKSTITVIAYLEKLADTAVVSQRGNINDSVRAVRNYMERFKVSDVSESSGED